MAAELVIIVAKASPKNRSAGGRDSMSTSSKEHLCRKLNLTRSAKIAGSKSRTSGNNPERRRAHCGRRVVKIGLVERVKRPRPNLEGVPLSEFRILGHREIQIREAGSDDNV